MYSEHARSLAVVVAVGCLPVAMAASPPVRLEVRPATCIAIHRGQTCFRAVTLTWPPLGEGAYCLLRDGAPDPLLCWRGDAYASWSHDYAAPDEERYRLVRTGPDGVPRDELGTATVSTASVYRGRRNSSSGWRLF